MTEFTAIRIKQIMKSKRIGNKALADMTGLPLGTLNKIIYGDTKSPTLDNMQAIAKALGCTLDDFVEDSVNSHPDLLTASEQALLADFRQLNDDGQEKVCEYTSDLVASRRYSLDGEKGDRSRSRKDETA